jgi:endonuclease III
MAENIAGPDKREPLLRLRGVGKQFGAVTVERQPPCPAATTTLAGL